MYKICFYVPESHLTEVKEALFKAGAGRIGDYDQCAWQVKGEGQFRALDGSSPFIGKHNELECVSEYRVELVSAKECIKEVVQALKSSHPYEEPAFDVMQVIDI